MNRRDGSIVRRLSGWFSHAARDLPWRAVDPATGRRDPYRSLVSELMLQQTQVSRVVGRFEAFVARFPTAGALAKAPERDVLAAWAGLGYYRRARLLHAAAKAIVARHGGQIPADPGAIRELPGVGRYTAGAVASMVFGLREPLVDGNVIRVLSRVEGRHGAPDEAATVAWAWERAGELVSQSDSPGVFNEALMELGATVCTPRSAQCGDCPLSRVCEARARGEVELIPRPKSAPRRTHHTWCCVVLKDPRGRALLEQRPDNGLWAGMWHVPTSPDIEAPPGDLPAGSALGRALSLPDTTLTYAGTIRRTLTHRRLEMRVWRGELTKAIRAGARRRWVTGPDLGTLGIPNAYLAVLDAAGDKAHTPRKAVRVG